MRIVTNQLRGTTHLSRLWAELSPRARQRLKWMEHYERYGDARLTCRYFGIAPPTFYRWRKRYDPHRLQSLEDRSSRPKRVRRPTWPPELVQAVQAKREKYPRWGKDKLVVLLLREDGWMVSTSMVGRILADLKRRGLLYEPPRARRCTRQRLSQRPHAVRKPRDYLAAEPGDLVQLDTQEQHPEPGVTLRHFGARDSVSRWDVLAVHTRATALIAREFLGEVLDRMPFEVKALQIDGGSEFKAEFEEACARLGVALFVLPPKSPKLNGKVERSHRTHEEEFYQCYDGDFTIAALQPALREQERIYNTVRPHQALGYLTPLAWLEQRQKEKTDQSGQTAQARLPSNQGDSIMNRPAHV